MRVATRAHIRSDLTTIREANVMSGQLTRGSWELKPRSNEAGG
ncbi:MAG TPA: hypothetical protein VF773_17430 [Verrucomicrobiae bacterium]